MERREDLHDGQSGVAFIDCRITLCSQSRRCDGLSSTLARVRAGDQVPLGEEHPDTGVSSEGLFICRQYAKNDESFSSSTVTSASEYTTCEYTYYKIR